ncbi:hypothetical protein FRB93_005945 [Tulasnella sp. JGI-2019a]|nr:hypothetical protein FRB93_005945 [Tulasnella sp. JGI-2019a]
MLQRINAHDNVESNLDLDLASILKGDLKDLAKEKNGLHNRLRSIHDDADFVDSVHREHYGHFPIVPNLRCGSWYVDPTVPQCVQIPAYFKSTDGHLNNWDFNLRRSNLHLLSRIEEKGGIIIVDSTRRGKRFPDALSKTVPIWCCVVNRAVALKFGLLTSFDINLYSPTSAVSRSEHSQIEQRLEGWTSKLSDSTFEIPRLLKPLRPIWISPATPALPQLKDDLDFYPVICLSASEHVENGIERRNGYSYVQGSGDDHESWSQGLTPALFWQNKAAIRTTPPWMIESFVSNIVASLPQSTAVPSTLQSMDPIVKVHSLISLGNSMETDPSKATIFISPTNDTNSAASPQVLWLRIPSGKVGQLDLMKALTRAIAFARMHLDAGTPVDIAGDDVSDVCTGVAMAVLQALFRDDGDYLGQPTSIEEISKQSIRKRLQWIQQSLQHVNPSKVTMNRVNEYFLSPPSMRSKLR